MSGKNKHKNQYLIFLCICVVVVILFIGALSLLRQDEPQYLSNSFSYEHQPEQIIKQMCIIIHIENIDCEGETTQVSTYVLTDD